MSTTATATRTRKGSKGSKATITVNVVSDGKTYARTMSGARAANASVVLVWWCARPGEAAVAYACRSDQVAARAEAARLTTATSIRTRYGTVPVTPVAWAMVVEVVEG